MKKLAGPWLSPKNPGFKLSVILQRGSVICESVVSPSVENTLDVILPRDT